MNRHYSTFAFDPSVKTQEDIAQNNRAGFETRSFTFVDYSHSSFISPGRLLSTTQHHQFHEQTDMHEL
jgi:hypothetical protein